MIRTVKAPDIRRTEILDTAQALFAERGYAGTSVDEIVRRMGVAKGTFYYYFRTKEDVLEALARRLVETMAEHTSAIADDSRLRPIEKLRAVFVAQRRLRNDGSVVVDGLHRPENRELHERSNIETVRTFGPILARIVEEGRREGIFDVDDSLATVQFILAGQLFLFGEGMFDWSTDEAAARARAMVRLAERALGAAPRSFDPLLHDALEDVRGPLAQAVPSQLSRASQRSKKVTKRKR